MPDSHCLTLTIDQHMKITYHVLFLSGEFTALSFVTRTRMIFIRNTKFICNRKHNKYSIAIQTAFEAFIKKHFATATTATL